MYRKITALLLAVCLTLSLGGCSVSGSATPPDLETDARGKLALALTADVTGGHYRAACDNYDYTEQMEGAMTTSLLYLSMVSLVKSGGRFESIESITPYGDAYYLGLAFKKQRMTAIVTFEGDLIAGFVFTDWVDPAALNPAFEKLLPEGTTETDVLFGDPQLPGKLVHPEGSTVVVILLSGSGPNDADETIGPNKPLRDIAYDLAAQGISSLRFDKRTKVYGQDIAYDYAFTPREEYVEDAANAHAYLLGHRDGYTKIFFAGHSMGGYMLPAIAKEVPDAAGFIYLSANFSPLPELARMQVAYLRTLGQATKAELATYDEMEKQLGRLASMTDDTPRDTVLFGAYPAYWRYLKAYDPAALVQEIEAPMLFIAGGRDYQVPTSELDLWKDALAEGDENALRMFHIFPELNHLLIPGEGQSNPDEYAVPGIVDLAVGADIAEFIRTAEGY
ncbi:MAG TPA: alpha/beta hydrolase [Candidatus Acidoferrum sp.]|nr:alpha/beta hydrolase [Candidatus Acidoferrum sp.]